MCIYIIYHNVKEYMACLYYFLKIVSIYIIIGNMNTNMNEFASCEVTKSFLFITTLDNQSSH